jgi:mannose-6-phosphate isomerase
LKGVGESWEISGVENNESVVANGPDKGLTLTDMVKKYREELVGEANYARFGNEFPLLIKFIDAKQDLSIQVHPTDERLRSATTQKVKLRCGM